jgi:hypothetical protein
VSPPTNSDLEKERQTQSQREKKKKKGHKTPRIVETIPLFPRLPPAVYYFFDSLTPTSPKTNKTYNAFE